MPLYLKYELKHFTSCFFVTETIAHAENGATTDQQFSVESIDSASNSVAPRRPPAQRSTSEYHTLAGSSPHYPSHPPPLRRLSSNPSELGPARAHRRVEGRLCKNAFLDTFTHTINNM